MYVSPAVQYAAALGFLEYTDEYTDAEVVSSCRAFLLESRATLIPFILSEDLPSGFAFYAEHGGITADNFLSEYLAPALDTGAAQCTAFLLEWKKTHLSDADWNLDE